MFISEIKPPDKGQIIYRDSALQGLGLRVTPKSMSYVVEGRVNGIFRRVTLGKESHLTPTDARKKAVKVLATMASGKDPTAEKTKRKLRGATLQVVLDHFLSVRILKSTAQGFLMCVPTHSILPSASLRRLPVFGSASWPIRRSHSERRREEADPFCKQ
jgi:hypothetical protein